MASSEVLTTVKIVLNDPLTCKGLLLPKAMNFTDGLGIVHCDFLCFHRFRFRSESQFLLWILRR